ncbi:histidine kinase OS=Castellaniella defragrans OX=75697 GN=HNR28_000809 PE=4 SV=1 [Castellaniella defragrans]
MRAVSLASRVTWALTGTVALFLLVMSLLAYEIFSRMEDDLVDNVLTEQVQSWRQDLMAGENLSSVLSARTDDGGLIQAWVRPLSAPVPDADLFASGGGGREIHRGGRTWHTWVESVPQGRLYVRYDATSHESRVRDFGWALAAGGLAVLLCGWWLARLLARRVVAPFHLVSERLSAWGPGEARRVSDTGDEATQLIEAFSRIQDHVDRSMAFERQFAANLSHELRTPLAALRSDGEMALLEVAADSPLRPRLQRMLAQVDTVASSLSGAVAFNSTDPSRMRVVSLSDALEEVWFALQPLAETRGLALMNQIPPGAQYWLDAPALLIVMRNLVRNAIEHAAPATLTVSLADVTTLTFHDDGPGMSPEQVALLRTWHSGRADLATARQSDSGHGLGLSIAQRVCDLQGWRFSVDASRAEMSGWTEFRLEFPSSTRTDRVGVSGSSQQYS